MEPARDAAADPRSGVLFAALAAILYGAAYPATAVALRSFTPLGIAGIACTIALPVVIVLSLAGVLPSPSRRIATRASLARLLVLSALGGFGFITAINVAVALSGSTVTGFVAPLYAVSAALFAIPVLGERVRPLTVLSFLLALAGTALLAGLEPNRSAWLGVGLASVAAAMFGLYIVLARRWGVRYHLDGTSVTIANLLSRGPILLAIEALRSPGTLLPAHADIAAVIALVSIALGSSSTANLLLIASTRRVPAGRTSAALLLTPVSSAIIGAIVLDERMSVVQAIGAVLILAGIAGASGLASLALARRRAAVASD